MAATVESLPPEVKLPEAKFPGFHTIVIGPDLERGQAGFVPTYARAATAPLS